MIITKNVKVKITPKEYSYYKNIGYDVQIGDYHDIRIEDLLKGSHSKVSVKCDVCENIVETIYYSYNQNIEKGGFYACSKKCANEKRKITNVEKYGCENVFQNEKIKNKSSKTKTSKYGNKNYVNVEKNKKTCLEKYGKEDYIRSDDFKIKSEKTKLNKYGTINTSSLQSTKNKMKKTKLDKYGDENYVNNDKYQKTCLKKYGVENYMKSQDYKNSKMSESSIKYDCNIIDFNGGVYTIYCDKCGKNYDISISNLIQRYYYKIDYCTNCKPIGDQSSFSENELKDFVLKNFDGDIILKDRNILSPKEIDIFIPILNIGIEFNGVYWHNELNKSNKYHMEKTEMAEKQGIRLVQIYQDDWIFKQEIVKSRILNLLNKTPNKIYARKCDVKEVSDNKLVRNFLETNHIQGFVGSRIKIGLFYSGELVSLMTFGSLRKAMGQKGEEGSYEMLRFCNKLNTNVIGGASRLFMFFVKNFEPKEVTSYADRSWSQGNLYKNLGFKLVSKTDPNYYYVIDGMRKHRFGFRKDELIKQGFDPNKTEHEIMLERKIYRIYDSGNLKFIWKPI